MQSFTSSSSLLCAQIRQIKCKVLMCKEGPTKIKIRGWGWGVNCDRALEGVGVKGNVKIMYTCNFDDVN